ncbi:MAG: protein kinase [Betaproteobacteria bacterium]|nr:protein kinase [Betaproteobacteria bacterium]
MASLPQTVRSIGRFEVVRQLGRGAQGSVWLAHDPELKREVAIKTIEVDGRNNPAAVRTLLDEAIMMSRLVHPNIVTLFDAGRDGEQPYLVFEFVAGSTLATLIEKSGQLQPARASEIAVQILKGIEFAHQKGVVHRDLKPGNIMMTEDGIPRIMDFGIAALISTRSAEEDGFHGTPAYTAPEYITKREFSPRSDVFSMGMMLYEMLTGSPAVSGKTVWELLHKVSTTPFDRPSTRAEQVDERLDALVMRALAKNPDERFESAQAFREALESYLRPAIAAVPTEAAGGTLDFLLRRIQVKSDFPALSGTISAVSRAANSTKEGVAALSATILKDFALTNKLLKLVNTARFGQLGRGVSTVSRAIMVMGFDQVRAIAIGLVLFDTLQNKSQAANLRDELIATYFSAVLGRSLAGPAGVRDGEEAFIAAMFHNLGRLLAAFYFHDEFLEMQKMARNGIAEREAAIRVFGTSLDELGVAVARSWNFPPNVIASMKEVTEDPDRVANGDAERLRMLSALAYAMTDAIRHSPDDDREGRLLAVQGRFDPALGVDQGQIIAAVGKSVADIARDAQTLDLKTTASPFFERAVSWSHQFSEDEEIETLSDTLTGAVLAEQAARGGESDAQSLPARRKATLSAGIQDITGALVGKFVLNDLLKIVVETVHRAGGFSRVMLLTSDPASNYMKARVALGVDAEQHVKKGFSVPLSGGRDIFQAALTQGVDISIDDIDAPKIRAHVPDWYRKAVPAKSVMLFPIVLNKKAVALLYGDADTAGALAFGAEELSLLKTLRNQVVLAIRTQNV